MFTSRCLNRHSIVPWSDPFRVVGNWRFCNRRWLSPDNVEDRAVLEQNYDALVSEFPIFARCTRQRFLQLLFEVSSHERWHFQAPAFGLRAAPPASYSIAFCERGGVPAADSPALFHRIPSTESELEMSLPAPAAADVPTDLLSADDAACTAATGAWPNAGEEVDIGLHQHWDCRPTLTTIEAAELERFGRSTSF